MNISCRRFFAFCIIMSALLFSVIPHGSRVFAATNWVDTGHADEMYQARNFGSVSQSPSGVRMFRTPMFDIIEMIFGAVPGLTVTADIMKNDPKYVQELNQKSAVAQVSNVIVAMYASPPADLALWIQDTGQTLGFLPKPVLAQGVGFSGLAPLLPIWKVFRNIAYLLLAVIMIVIGFMVMLRKKIDPKTVVTVQNALPRIVITLLLITFSYAIVGIMIDLMYVVILAAVALFKNSNLLPDPSGTWVKLAGITTPEQLYSQGGVLQNVDALDFNPYKLLFGQNVNQLAGDIGMFLIGGFLFIAGLLSPCTPLCAIPGGAIALAMPLVGFLISLAALFLIIRLFIFFLGAYIKILVSLIFGPVQILFEAIPGTNAFASWFNNLLTNILVFPIGSLMFMLSAVFIKFSDSQTAIWSPPFSSLFGYNLTSISSWIAMGIMFAIPSVTNSIQDMLKAKPLLSAGPEGMVGAISQPTMIGWQIGQFLMQHNQMAGLAKQIGANNAQKSSTHDKPPNG